MPDPIRSDEELEAEFQAHMDALGEDEASRQRLRAEHHRTMQQRREAREAAQTHYEAGKGRAPAKDWTAADAQAYAKGTDGN